MVAVPESTVLVCWACGSVVKTLTLNLQGATILRPCGHSAGYKSVPASTLAHGSAA